MTPLIIDIYRSSKKEGLYVYLKKDDTVDSLPEEFKKHCGKLEHSMRMLLTPEKKLANADTKKVIAQLSERGYYIQMPPQNTDSYMQTIPNDKLAK